MLFADLLDVRDGEERKVLSWAKGQPDITIIFGPSSAYYCREQKYSRHLEFQSHNPTLQEIAKSIASEITAQSATGQIPYVTFNRGLLTSLAEELKKIGVENVTPVHWSDQFPRNPQYQTSNVPLQRVKVTDDQVNDLVTLLAEDRIFSESNSVFMSALRRPFTRRFGSRYSKQAPGVGSGFFSALIRRAVALNKVKASNPDTVMTRVWIEPGAAVQIAPATTREQSVAPTLQPPLMPPSNTHKGSVYPSEWDARFAKASLGPFPNFRADLFRELENLVNGKRTGYILIQEAVDLVRRQIDDARAKRGDNAERHGWLSAGAAERFLKTMLCRNETLLNESGEKFCFSTANAFLPVVKLVPSFRDQLEQDLLLYLVEIQSPFTIDDLSKAAVFLFGKRNPRDTLRVQELMMLLVESKKVMPEGDAWVVVQN